MYALKMLRKSLMITLIISIIIVLVSCAHPVQLPHRNYFVPSKPKITWHEHGDMVCLTKDDAILLMRYLNEVDAYIAMTQIE